MGPAHRIIIINDDPVDHEPDEKCSRAALCICFSFAAPPLVYIIIMAFMLLVNRPQPQQQCFREVPDNLPPPPGRGGAQVYPVQGRAAPVYPVQGTQTAERSVGTPV